MADYDWSQFDVAMVIDAPLERVFAAWATPAGLESFFIQNAAFTRLDGTPRAKDELADAGDRYSFQFVHEFTLDGHFITVNPPQEVSFSFGEPMIVTIRLSANADGRTLCALTQANIPADSAHHPFSHMNCRSCWIYFLMALKARLEHDIELRDMDPQTADSVSVHLAPKLANQARRDT